MQTSRSVKFSSFCQICAKRPWYGSIASYRVCSHCGDVLKEIATTAGVPFQWDEIRKEEAPVDVAVVAGSRNSFNAIVDKLGLHPQYTHHILKPGKMKDTVFGRVIYTCGWKTVTVTFITAPGVVPEHISCCDTEEPE